MKNNWHSREPSVSDTCLGVTGRRDGHEPTQPPGSPRKPSNFKLTHYLEGIVLDMYVAFRGRPRNGVPADQAANFKLRNYLAAYFRPPRGDPFCGPPLVKESAQGDRRTLAARQSRCPLVTRTA